MAGYLGCAGPDVSLTNTLRNAARLPWNLAQPIQGFEASGSNAWTPALPSSASPHFGPDNPLSGRDVLVLRGMADSNGVRVLQHAAGTPAGSEGLRVAAGSGLAANDIVLASDCLAAAAFQITGISTSGGFETLGHGADASAGLTPGNASTDLGKEFAGGEIVKIATRTYYVRNNATGAPALFRRQGAADAEELVEGVEDLQISYGVDDTGDFTADRYVAADVVESEGKWSGVVSVELRVLVRSAENEVVPAAQTYAFNGSSATSADRRLRQAFSATVALRNRSN
jgi:type IV pilus assembly protein PilW